MDDLDTYRIRVGLYRSVIRKASGRTRHAARHHLAAPTRRKVPRSDLFYLFLYFFVLLCVSQAILHCSFHRLSTSQAQNAQSEWTSPIVRPAQLWNGQSEWTSPSICPVKLQNGQSEWTSPSVCSAQLWNGQSEWTSPSICPAQLQNGQSEWTSPRVCPVKLQNGQSEWTSPSVCPVQLQNGQSEWTSPSVCYVHCRLACVTRREGVVCVIFNCICDPLLGNSGIHAYNGNPRSSRHGLSSTDETELPPQLCKCHVEMVNELNSKLNKEMTSQWNKFRFAVKRNTTLTKDKIDKADDIFTVCDLLEEHDEIQPGAYSKLKDCLVGIPDCLAIIHRWEVTMRSLTSSQQADETGHWDQDPKSGENQSAVVSEPGQSENDGEIVHTASVYQVVQQVYNQQTDFRVKPALSIRTAGQVICGDHNVIHCGPDYTRRIDHDQQTRLIDQTKAWILQATPFVQTKALSDAKEKLLRNKCVIIIGNSGKGKTFMAIKLLHWLMHGDGDQGPEKRRGSRKAPIVLGDLKTWDTTIVSNSSLSILFDDMFGYDSQSDIDWWRKRESFISPMLEGEMNESSNCLIITIRTDVFKEFSYLFSHHNLLNADNIIDLHSSEYNLEDEKRNMLSAYTHSLDNFEEFSEKEITVIVNCSSVIGFPECCRLFASVPDLKTKRVDFFKNPLRHLKQVIQYKFDGNKQAALLYLLLTSDEITNNSLDPGNSSPSKANAKTVATVFDISLNLHKQSIAYYQSNGEKLQRLSMGLKSLCDSFVKIEDGIYQFFHDCVRDAVAILYGEVTPLGFLKHCNISCLRYIVTSQSEDKVMIEKDVFPSVYERIFVELQSGDSANYNTVASLMVWRDVDFVAGFFQWIERTEVDLNSLCKAKNTKDGDEFSEADADRAGDEHIYSFVVYVSTFDNHVLLKQILERIPTSNIQLKYALDESLSAGSETSALLLLEKSVKPDIKSCFCAVDGGMLTLLQKVVKHVDILGARRDKSKSRFLVKHLSILSEACLLQRLDMVEWLIKKYPKLLYEDGVSILHVAAVVGRIDLYKTHESEILKGKSTEECQRHMNTLLDCNYKGNVLHAACLSGSKELCMYLHSKFPSLILQRDTDGRHCLHHCAVAGNLNCYKYIESLVLKGKTGMECQTFMEKLVDDQYKRTIHTACQYGNTELCAYIHNNYPSLISQRDKRGRHCLHFAARSGSLFCYKYVEDLVERVKLDRGNSNYMQTLLSHDGNTVLDEAKCGELKHGIDTKAVRDYIATKSASTSTQ